MNGIECKLDCDASPRKYGRLRLSDIDFTRRTICCRRINEEEEEEEIYTTADELSAEEEEHIELDEPTSETERALRLMDALECLKRQIQFIQLAIKRQRDAKEVNFEVYEDDDDDDNASTVLRLRDDCANSQKVSDLALDINRLQKDEHRLQCTLNGLIEHYRGLNDVLLQMRRQGCAFDKQIRKMEVAIEDLASWKEQVSGEVDACHQRHAYLERVKCTASRCVSMMKSQLEGAVKSLGNFLRVSSFEHSKSEFMAESKELIRFTEELRLDIDRKFVDIDKYRNTLMQIDNFDDEPCCVVCCGDKWSHGWSQNAMM